MIDMVNRFFSKTSEHLPGATNRDPDHDIRVATCALLVEIAQIDETFTQGELDKILSILKEKYGLSEEHAETLISEAEKALEDSVDLWQFAKLINENYSNAEKIEVIETLWRIVYVDGKMDQYEHYLMGKLQHLLRLSHEDLINAKLKVLHSS